MLLRSSRGSPQPLKMPAALVALVVATLCASPPQVSASCGEECRCPLETPRCAAGGSLVLDGCGCCKVCARQLFERCSEARPCDRTRGLECNFGGAHGSARGICRAKSDGRTCEYNSKIYQNGETFRPNCKHQCTCMDGTVGCVSLCPPERALPSRGCARPRPVKVPGLCCEQLVCPEDVAKEVEKFGQDLKNELATAWRGVRGHPKRAECRSQTSPWSPCSRSCGAGVSTRVTSGNAQCKPVKETRLCEIRPCSQMAVARLKDGQKCNHVEKAGRPVRLLSAGCRSVRKFRPRFCGSCADGRCCAPHRTRTAPVRFRCKSGQVLSRLVMMIQSCKCKLSCSGSAEKPAAPHGLFNDIHKLKM